VLRVAFPILALRKSLLGAEYAKATVDYTAFLHRFQLARPELDPLYKRHEYLLALMYKVDADGSGQISISEFNMVCAVMAQHFEHEPGVELCSTPQEFLAALGPAGKTAMECGSVYIGMVAEQFTLKTVKERRPSLLALMHHLDRNEIRSLARPAVPLEVSEADGSQRNSEAGADC